MKDRFPFSQPIFILLASLRVYFYGGLVQSLRLSERSVAECRKPLEPSDCVRKVKRGVEKSIPCPRKNVTREEKNKNPSIFPD